MVSQLLEFGFLFNALSLIPSFFVSAHIIVDIVLEFPLLLLKLSFLGFLISEMSYDAQG